MNEPKGFEINKEEQFITTKDLIKASGQLLKEKIEKLDVYFTVGGMSTLAMGVATTGFMLYAGNEMVQNIQATEGIPYAQALWNYITPNLDLTQTMAEAHTYWGQWSPVALAPVGLVGIGLGVAEIKQGLTTE
ncbi:MAG: hypothetical protein AAB778_00070 [Patescibacteria group bacterium]